jgi:hypothetical protein
MLLGGFFVPSISGNVCEQVTLLIMHGQYMCKATYGLLDDLTGVLHYKMFLLEPCMI